ncbi:MAG: hypothetical protein JO197_16980 [Acidobacteria bacterium]|nr:hypothetical protein [Acidobacteriota bacterium]MBV9478482.1 hypothetical protein [Acidobacteriota bacterium]
MIDLDKAFAALPPAEADPRDSGTARAIWLRARMAAMVEEDARAVRLRRLRFASAALFVTAMDAIALLVIASVFTTSR